MTSSKPTLAEVLSALQEAVGAVQEVASEQALQPEGLSGSRRPGQRRAQLDGQVTFEIELAGSVSGGTLVLDDAGGVKVRLAGTLEAPGDQEVEKDDD